MNFGDRASTKPQPSTPGSGEWNLILQIESKLASADPKFSLLKMTILSYYQLDYQGVNQLTGTLDLLEPKPTTIVSKTIIPGRFKSDVEALCEYTGLQELTPGLTIRMSLKEALQVMARKRRRVDAFKSLVDYLQDEMDVTLIINSQKTKRNG